MGKTHNLKPPMNGFDAVALQHEIDHLDGILFLDRIRSSKDLFERRRTAPPELDERIRASQVQEDSHGG